MPSSVAPGGRTGGALPPERARVRAATPTDVSAAIAARRRRERRRHLVTLGIGLLVVALLAALVWLVGYSPVLASKVVRVEGNKLVSTAEVRLAADVPMGVPLARLDTLPVADRVAALAPVASVNVHTDWPDTVVVEVTERVAVYQRHEGGYWQSVDAAGVVFATAQRKDAALPEAQTATVDNALLADVATVVSSLTPALRSRLDRVEATNRDQVTVRLKTGQQVVWGSADDSTTKAQVAQALVGQKGFTIFNVSSPGNPTAR